MFSLLKLARDRNGVTIIEFAFVAPVLVLLLTGLLEFGYVLFARSTLESSVLAASRSSRVADCPNENAKALEAELQSRMSVVSSADGEPAKLQVESYGSRFGDVGNPEPFDDANTNGTRDDGESYTDVNGNGVWDEDMGRTGNYGSFGEVVRFRATYNVRSLVPSVAKQFTNGKGYYEIESTTVARNEPFRETSCAL